MTHPDKEKQDFSENINFYPFGEHFRSWREKRGYSLKEAADNIVSVQHLSQFELGKKNINLTLLSRLLMSIGVDWDEFIQDFSGLRVRKYQENLNQFFSNPKAQTIPVFIKEIAPHYEDYPEALTMIEDILTITREILAIGDQSKPEPNHFLINQVLNTKAINPLEFDYILAHLNQGTLKSQQIISLANMIMIELEKALNPHALNFNAASNYLTINNRLINYLSQIGEAKRAEQMISKTRELMRPLGAGNRFVIQSLGLDMQDAYNLLRLGREDEANQLAKKITTYMEANIAYGHDPELHRWFIEAKKVFMGTFKETRQKINGNKS